MYKAARGTATAVVAVRKLLSILRIDFAASSFRPCSFAAVSFSCGNATSYMICVSSLGAVFLDVKHDDDTYRNLLSEELT